MFNKSLRQELQACEEDRKRIQAILEAIRGAAAYIEFSPSGHILDVNDRFLSVVGYHRDQVIGEHHRLFCEAGYAQSSAYSEFWSILRQGSPHAGTFPRIKRDGQRLWLEATYFPVLDEQGEVERVVKIASDVTERTEELRDHEAVLSALDRSMAVISFTPTGEVLNANQNFLDTVGYGLSDVRGKHHRMFCDEHFYQENPDFWAELAAGAFKSGKFRRLRADGTEVWLEATYNPIVGKSGSVERIIKFATDITSSVHASERAREASSFAYDTANQTASIAEQGASALRESIGTSDEILDLVSKTRDVVAKLDADSKNIETIVATINDVAKKTNLLALNAAIEAARAGEQGRGFAVVADEVLQLAQRTSDATEEIDEVIRGNIEYTGEIVRRIEKASDVANQGQEQVRSVEELVSEIRSGATDVLTSVSSLLNEKP